MYMGFDALKAKIAARGGVRNPGAAESYMKGLRGGK